jgi:signal transduction histidine kinase/PAS domain-containing protein
MPGVSTIQSSRRRHVDDYTRLLSAMPAAVYSCDKDGLITYYNRQAAEIWGREPELGDPEEKFCGSLRLYYADGTPLPHEHTPMAAAVKSGQSFRDTDVVIERPDGSWVMVNVNVSPLYDEDGAFAGAVNVFTDVTRRRRLWQEHQRQRDSLERLISEAPAAIAMLRGAEHRYTLCNPAYRAVARGKGELVGRTVAEVWPETGDAITSLLDNVFQTGQPFHVAEMKLELVRDRGMEDAYFTFTLTPLLDPDGHSEGVLIIAIETTAQVLAKRQIETERSLLEAVLAQMPSGVVIAEAPSGKLILGNEQVEKIWRQGYVAAGDVEGYRAYTGFHADGRSYEPEEWPLARSIHRGEVIQDEEIIFKRGDASYGVMSVASAPVHDQDGQITAGVATFSDISQRRQAETLRLGQLRVLELLARGEPLASILEVVARIIEAQSRDAVASILLVDEEGRLRHGAAPSLSEVYNEAVDGIWPDANIGTCAAAVARREMVVTTDIATDPAWRTLRHLPLDATLKAAWSMPIIAADGRVLGTVGTYFRENRGPTIQEREMVELLASTALMAIERKRVEGEREQLLRTLERERARLKELAQSLEQRVLQRTEQVHKLATALNLAEQRERARLSQVLHDDLQQLLYSELMRIEVLRRQLSDEQQTALHELISGLVQHLEQAVQVTRTLATELNPPQMESSSLPECLDWLARHMEEAHALEVTLRVRDGADLVAGEARSMLLHLVRELLFNVVKHAGTRQAYVELSTQNGLVVVCIEDNGNGFDVTAVTRNGSDQGTGLGLLSAEDRLALIGGRLEIRSSPGQGTQVAILVPAQT